MKNIKASNIAEHSKRLCAALGLVGALICASVLNHAYAAVIIGEDFENDGLNTAYFAVNSGSFDGPRTARDWHWQRHSTNTTNNTNFYRGFQGQDFWTGINLDENGSSATSPSTLSFNSVDISHYQNARLSMSVASSGGLESSDYLAIYAQDLSSSNASALPPNNQQRILIDSFFGGIGLNNTIELNADFQTVSYDLSSLNFDVFSLHFDAFTNASKESIAFDDIVISGDLIADSKESEVITASSPRAFSAMSLMALAFVFAKRRIKLG